LVYADDNVLGGSVHTIKENTEPLVVASEEIGLEVIADKTKYMVLPQDQIAGQSHNIKIQIHKTKILFVDLYGYETWSQTLSGVCRPRVFENRVLRRIFGPRRNEVTGEWRKLH
jgi:hypothetical protein